MTSSKISNNNVNKLKRITQYQIYDELFIEALKL